MRILCMCLAALSVLLWSAAPGNAQVLVAEFSEETIPTNPMNGYGSFTFDDFSVAGAITDGPDSLIFDVQTDDDGNNGFFGGIGVDYGINTEVAPEVFLLLPLDFDPAVSWWEMRVRLLENNAASTVNTVYRDVDTIDGANAEEFQFNFDLTSIPSDGEFHIISVDATNFGFFQTSAGTPDGVNNPGLNQIQIQSVYGSSDRLNIEVDWVRIYTVPEPSGLVLLGLGGVAACLLRRRR
ncbi:PEP-CTERM sorting domain-containing protein [Aeoliella sp.]|uniref:PEP-CTERM sorting domain-containing protein n=1 Tax=Aeoliella sp. TaxID=2795800 RepID=UPI003CCC00E2